MENSNGRYIELDSMADYLSLDAKDLDLSISCKWFTTRLVPYVLGWNICIASQILHVQNLVLGGGSYNHSPGLQIFRTMRKSVLMHFLWKNVMINWNYGEYYPIVFV